MLRFRDLGLRWFSCFAALLLSAAVAQADTPAYAKFVGVYEGVGFVDLQGPLQIRDLKVEIIEADKGFTVTWVSVSRRASGKTKRKSYTIDFVASRRDGIYSAAMRTDLFGNRVPLDPLSGDPYVWARVDGDSLFVYAMLITEHGGYEMQVYKRTLTPTGLKLDYSLVNDGVVEKTIVASLIKLD